jgi:hypothetical protein
MLSVLAACSSGGDGGTGPDPSGGSISISINPGTLTLSQEADGELTVTLTRSGDFSGSVTVTATGVPQGVTIQGGTISPGVTSAQLAVTVASGATVGSATVTIQATGSGVSSATGTFTLTVEELVTGSLLSFNQCFQAAPITWMAFQDGGGPWNAVVPVGSVFSFEMAQPRGTLAVVQNAGGSPRITIMHLTADEIALLASDGCPIVYPARSVSGSVAGVAGADLVNVNLGRGVRFLAPGTTDFQLTNLPEGALDLLATQYTTFPAEFKKIVIRRDLDPADGAVLPVIDFSAPEAVAPVVNDLTIENILGETTSTVVNYLMGDGVTGYVLYAEPEVSANSNRTYHGVPAALFQAGDLHRLTAQATAADLMTTRSVTRYFGGATPQTLTLPAAIGPTPITAETNNPYVRLRLQYEPQADYDSYYTAFFMQNDGITTRQVTENFSAGYLAGANIDFTFPDFSSLTGWNDLWALQPGSLITGSVSAVGWTGVGLIAFPIPEVGTRIFTGARVQIEINP